MAHNFSQFKQAAEATVEWLRKEYSSIRTGRATPSILDIVQVEVYGSKMGLNQLANINLEDARTIRIVPWDSSVTKLIESAIQQSSLGLSVSLDDRGLRAIFPELTTERRTALSKVAKQKLEEARIRVRTEREKVHSDLDKGEKTGTLPKDDAFRAKQDLQKLVEETNKKLEDLLEKKEKEILE